MPYDSTKTWVSGNFNFNAPQPQVMGEALGDNRYQGVASDGSIGGYLPLRVGTRFATWDGREFVFVENNSATAWVEGNIISATALVAVTAGTLAADKLSVTGTAGATIYENEWRGGYCYFSAATGTGADGQCRRIVYNTAAASSASVTVYFERPMAAAATSVTAQLYHPYRCVLTPAAVANRVLGVSYGAVPAQTSSGLAAGGVSYYGWVQTKGFCEKVIVDAAVNIGSNQLVPSAANAGQAKAIVANGTTALELQYIFGVLPHGFTNYDAFVPAHLYGGAGS